MEMNVEESDLALVFGPSKEAGKVVEVRRAFDVDARIGPRWVVRIWGDRDFILPDSDLMPLNIDPTQDPEAREILDEAGQAAWDHWSTPPNVDF